MEFQHTGCNFSVIIAPIELTGNFSAVSGLGTEIEYEEFREGGNFTKQIILPTGVKHSNIVLSRGTALVEPLTIWFNSVQAGMHLRYPMIITMMDSRRTPVKIWTVLDAMPIKVDYSELNAMSGEVAITTIEFIHGEIVSVM